MSIAFALAFTIASCGSDDDNPTSENHKPVVSEVSIRGDIAVGEELTASAKSDDENGDDVTLKYQWYTAPDDQGAVEVAVDGETSETYTTVANDADQFITVKVTPTDGEDDGDEVTADYVGS